MRNIIYKNYFNTKGFSLVELMIAMGVGTVLMIAMFTSLTETFRSQLTADAGQEITALMYEVNGILGNSSICSAKLQGIPSVDDTAIVITDAIRDNQTYSHLDITTVRLKSVVNFPDNNSSAEIVVTGQRRANVQGSKGFTESAKIYYSTVGGVIDKCLGAAGTPETDCSSLGGIWNGSRCDFCTSLGGSVQADGTCAIGGSTVYAWQLGAFGSCSAGLQFRTVQCTDSSTELIVAETMCLTAKPLATQSCANYMWQIGAYGSCSGGVMARPISCVDSITLAISPNGDIDCSMPKPGSMQSCSGSSCELVAGQSWSTGGVTCNSSFSAMILDGSSAAVADTIGTTTGVARFSCANGTLSAPTADSCSEFIVGGGG